MSTNPAIEPKVRKFESFQGADTTKSDGLFPTLLNKSL